MNVELTPKPPFIVGHVLLEMPLSVIQHPPIISELAEQGHHLPYCLHERGLVTRARPPFQLAHARLKSASLGLLRRLLEWRIELLVGGVKQVVGLERSVHVARHVATSQFEHERKLENTAKHDTPQARRQCPT